MNRLGIRAAVTASFIVLMASLVSSVDDPSRSPMLTMVCYDANNKPYKCNIETTLVNNPINLIVVDDITRNVTAAETEQPTNIVEGTVSLDTTTVTVDTSTTEAPSTTCVKQYTDSIPTSAQLARCPFGEKSGRTIVDFTNGGTEMLRDMVLVANEGVIEASNSKRTELSPGVYDIHLASMHSVDSIDTSASYNERWRVDLYASEGQRLLMSEPTRYAYHDELYVVETVERGVTLSKEVKNVIAQHVAYKSDESYAFAPLCAAFDFQEPTNQFYSGNGKSTQEE